LNVAAKYPQWDVRKLDRRLRDLGCRLVRTTGGHRHYSNPFRPEQLITFSVHPGDVPRGIIADIIRDLGITSDQFYDPDYPPKGKRGSQAQ
jgi:predicted RNA binding protein YcfA (HicA-like mRNA interferase family)